MTAATAHRQAKGNTEINGAIVPDAGQVPSHEGFLYEGIGGILFFVLVPLAASLLDLEVERTLIYDPLFS